MVRLPVSGRDLILLSPTGEDELAVSRNAGSASAAGALLLERLARTREGEAVDVGALTVTDFEAALLGLRRQLVGPVLRSVFDCPACGERVEAEAPVDLYLAGVRPRTPREVQADGREGWRRLGAVAFRLPTVADQAAVEGDPRGAARLAERCLEPADAPEAERRRADRAMAAMAPLVSRTLVGRCPDCGGVVRGFLHVASFVVAELRRLAAAVLDEAHLIAGAYHWSEAAILALPGERRRHYAARIRSERLAGAGAEPWGRLGLEA